MDAPGLEAALRKAGGDSTGKSEEQEKATVGPGSPALLPSPQHKAEAGGRGCKGTAWEHLGGCRGREQLKIKAPSPCSWVKESLPPPCPPYHAASGGCAPLCAHPAGMGQHISLALPPVWGQWTGGINPGSNAQSGGKAGAQQVPPSNPPRGEDDTTQLRLNPREMGELSTP